ncbi:MAG: HD domain-containing protein [Bacteroidia bacterium]|nr:HD domain-containing protein [Bacteroidia bacterium]
MSKTKADILKDLEIFQKEYEKLHREYKEVLSQNERLIAINKKNEEILASLQTRGLKEGESGKDKLLRYKMVSVLYANIQGFSKLTEQIGAEALIDDLDKFFLHLDTIVAKYNIEKINSIGDTYMSAGGIPQKNRTNPIEIILAALEIQQHMKILQAEYLKNNKKLWEISIGIHTGPVTANIVGKKKISYELKGDTVNMASRIQASGEIGKITISEMTHEFVEGFFRCEYIGKMPVKYMGDISLYLVKGFSPDYSIDNEGLIPNKKFKIRFALVKYDDLEEFILNKLEKELPKQLYYHNLKHTIDVTNQAELIGRGEGINDEEMLLLKTAALFHDLGHTIHSKDHEFIGTQLVKEILPLYGYDEEQMEIINGIIMATKLPPCPHTLLQRIICDSDLDYLGRADFIPVSDTLFQELKAQNFINNIDDWNRLQIKFLSSHQYFTETANKLREVNKQQQIERISKLLPENRDK